MQVKDKHFKIFIEEEAIQARIQALGKQITKDYEGKRPLFIAILNGAFMFASDLLKSVNIDCEISFVKLASYDAMQSSGNVQSLIGLKESIAERHIILVEDIVDTGNTMQHVLPVFEAEKPASVEIATLLLKPEALTKPLALRYVGFEIPNKFVVGFGLDYDGLGRNLPEIYQLQEE